MTKAPEQIIHANCVDIDGSGILIQGKSGSGKSTLTLQLIALGAHLVSDDQTELRVVNQHLVATAPTAISGLIEARGVGILSVPSIPSTKIKFLLDLESLTTERLPLHRSKSILGLNIAVIQKSETPAFAEAVFLAAKFGLSKHV